MADLDAALDDDIGDDLLRLVFTSCHPVLAREARVALTLRLLGGLTTAEIARAYLVPEATVAQRLVRAKRTLADARVPVRGARAGPTAPRAFPRSSRSCTSSSTRAMQRRQATTGCAPSSARRRSGSDGFWRLSRRRSPRSTVSSRSWRSRRRARRRGRVPRGEPVLLLEQDRGRWDHILIGRGLAALAKAEASGPPGPYALQAAIAACHARARTAGETDWARIAALYGELARAAPSPVVELNRAVAVGMARGAGGGARARGRARRRARPRGATTSSRACAAISSRSSAGGARRASSSRRPRRWPATRASARSSSPGPPPPGAPEPERVPLDKKAPG